MKKLRRESADVVVGIDQSASGSAAVELVDGRLRRMMFFADAKKKCRELKKTCGDLVRPVEPVIVKGGDEAAKTRRLCLLRTELTRFVAVCNPTHVAFEGYAMTKAPVASRVLGEVGGVVRLVLADLRVPFRVYEIESVKTFACGKADAEKADMVLACRDRWDEPNFLRYGKTDGAAGNLADAYVIAQLLHLELRVRADPALLVDLPRPDRAVLQHTTPKKQPISIIEQPFVDLTKDKAQRVG